MDEHLKAVRLGSYLPHHALINLSRDASPWNDENEPNVRRLSVFIHEYAHFLHNYSTVAGVYDFVAQLRLLRLFINTVDQSGVSLGDSALDQESRDELQASLQFRANILGHTVDSSGNLAAAPPPEGELKIKEARLGSTPINFRNQTLDAPWAELRLISKALDREFTYRLGNQAIMEGTAWEFERIFHQAAGESTIELDSNFPDYPYKISRPTFEGITNLAPSSAVMARLLMLSMLSSNSGYMLLHIASRVRDLGPLDSAEVALDAILAENSSTFKSNIDEVLKMLRSESEGFLDRGPVGNGIKIMVEWAEKLLALRKNSFFFEIELLERGLDNGALRDLLNLCPPCPVLQDTSDKKELIYLAEQELSEIELGYLGAAQGMMQFAASHITSQHIVSSDNAKRNECRFNGVCGVPPEHTIHDMCKQHPWRAFDPDQNEGCWYAAGVAHTRGIMT